MEISKQAQSAGNNAQQFQAETVNVTVYQGITEERARELFVEMSRKAIADNTEEAFEVANQRVSQFENQLIPRIQQIEENFNSFSDPAFQVLLKKAQLTAACSEREDDYSILSELLVHRIKNKSNVKKKASITKAVEIIDQIDEDSLQALTTFHAISYFSPIPGNISEGLRVLDELYLKLRVDNLPTDSLWIDNLSILGAINTTSFGGLKKYEQYFSENLSGYVCAGIKKGSSAHSRAVELLKENAILENILIDNELLPEYLRLPITNEQAINNLQFECSIVKGTKINLTLPLSDKQKDCLKEIFSMYDKDKDLISRVKSSFVEKLDSYPNIMKARAWWNSLSGSINLTSVGRVIAHTNAKSIDNSLPDLD